MSLNELRGCTTGGAAVVLIIWLIRNLARQAYKGGHQEKVTRGSERLAKGVLAVSWFWNLPPEQQAV
jgi:hypothetical protein